MDKKFLRQNIKQELSSLSSVELRERSLSLSRTLNNVASDLSKNLGFKKIGVYAPIQYEPLWYVDFHTQDFEFLLVHMSGDFKLSYHPVEFEMIKNEAYGLELFEQILKNSDTPEVLLIPGLAFTKDCERLGRGKAYFDNYLKNFSGVKIGVCFEEQIVENVFSEQHDVAMDIVVTQKNIYRRGK